MFRDKSEVLAFIDTASGDQTLRAGHIDAFSEAVKIGKSKVVDGDFANTFHEVTTSSNRIALEDYDDHPCVHFNITGSPSTITFTWSPTMISDVRAMNITFITNSSASLAFASDFKMTDIPVIVPNKMFGFYLIADVGSTIFGFSNYGSGEDR